MSTSVHKCANYPQPFNTFNSYLKLQWFFAFEVCKYLANVRKIRCVGRQLEILLINAWLHLIFTLPGTYYDHGIQCIKYNKESKIPKGIEINYTDMRAFLKENFYIDFNEDALEEYIENHIHDNAYKTCLQS